MQCKLKQSFVFALLKLMLIFFSSAPVLSLMLRVRPSPITKKLFFRLSVWDNELLSTPKTTIFLAKSLPKLHEPSPSNAIPWPLKVNLLFIVFLTNVTVPNKQFFREQLLAGLRG